MKRKHALSAILVIFVVSIPFGLIINGAIAATVVSLTPAVISDQSLTMGSTLQLKVHVDAISNLWAWRISLAWNSSVLEMNGPPVEGPLLKASYSTIFLPATPDNTAGVLEEQACTIFGAGGVSGSGDLATLTFKVVGYGSSNIDMNSTMMEYGSSGNHVQIPCSTAGATFSLQNPNPPPPPSSGSHGPTASFAPANGTFFSTGETVVLDASSSTPGYDVEGANETCPITNYAWRVEFANGTAVNSFSGKTVSFTPTTLGILRIILIVTAPDPTPPSATDFVSTNTTAALIFLADASQATLDVYTNKGGVGQSVDSSAFGPQELIKVYALVNYSDVAIPNKDVAFSVKSANGSVAGIRVGRTNSSGYAYIDFRLPWPDDPSTVLGTWSVTATVDVSQRVLSDTVSFAYNYLVTANSIQLPAYAKRLTSIPINVTFTSISDMPVWSRLAITIYDEAKVPIGFFTVANTNQLKGNITINASIFIPGWAFVGQATVYVAILTDLPDKGGVPFSQETSANFQIQP